MSQSYIRKPNIESREHSTKFCVNFELIPELPMKHIGDFFENFSPYLYHIQENPVQSRKNIVQNIHKFPDGFKGMIFLRNTFIYVGIFRKFFTMLQ